jgi:hypothetical protein
MKQQTNNSERKKRTNTLTEVKKGSTKKRSISLERLKNAMNTKQ